MCVVTAMKYPIAADIVLCRRRSANGCSSLSTMREEADLLGARSPICVGFIEPDWRTTNDMAIYYISVAELWASLPLKPDLSWRGRDHLRQWAIFYDRTAENPVVFRRAQPWETSNPIGQGCPAARGSSGFYHEWARNRLPLVRISLLKPSATRSSPLEARQSVMLIEASIAWSIWSGSRT